MPEDSPGAGLLDELLGRMREQSDELSTERTKFEETRKFEYLVLAIGRTGRLPVWVREACRRFAEEYETSLKRFDDGTELGQYDHDIELLIEMGRLVWSGRGPSSAANEVARIHETDEDRVEATSMRLYRIWNRERERTSDEQRWKGEAIRRFLASDETKAWFDKWLDSEEFQNVSEEILASRATDGSTNGD